MSWVGTEFVPAHENVFTSEELKLIDLLVGYVVFTGSRNLICRNPKFFPFLKKLMDGADDFSGLPNSKFHGRRFRMMDSFTVSSEGETDEPDLYYLSFSTNFVRTITGLSIDVIAASDNEFKDWLW